MFSKFSFLSISVKYVCDHYIFYFLEENKTYWAPLGAENRIICNLSRIYLVLLNFMWAVAIFIEDFFKFLSALFLFIFLGLVVTPKSLFLCEFTKKSKGRWWKYEIIPDFQHVFLQHNGFIFFQSIYLFLKNIKGLSLHKSFLQEGVYVLFNFNYHLSHYLQETILSSFSLNFYLKNKVTKRKINV